MENLSTTRQVSWTRPLGVGVALTLMILFPASVQAQTAGEYRDIFKASLAIDHIRDLRYGRGDRQVADSHAGDSVVRRLSRQNTDAPNWTARSLLNGNVSQYRLWIYRDFGRNKLNFSIFSDAETMYVTFWGTTDNNQNGNAALAVVNPAYDNSTTHAGWAAMAFDNYNTISAEMRKQGVATKRLIMTGHSQGGAVAGHLMYLALKNGLLNRGKPHRLVNFGAPRYGTPSLRNNFNRLIRTRAPQTKAYDVEIEEDHLTTLWTSIVSLGISNDVCYMGTRIRRPKAFTGYSADDPHNHLHYVWLAYKLANATQSRPRTDISSIAVLRSTRLAETADRISVMDSRRNDFNVSIRLEAAANISWWKAIKIFKNGRLIKEIYTQDNRRNDAYVVTVSPTDSYHLEFCKAKAFGAHTPIKKHSIDLYNLRGLALRFKWTKD